MRWRTGRHREALWKSLVLPAGGVALCWLLLMTLGLPILDYARSNRPLVERLSRHVPAARMHRRARTRRARLIAALEYFGRYRVDARDGADADALQLPASGSNRSASRPRRPKAGHASPASAGPPTATT